MINGVVSNYVAVSISNWDVGAVSLSFIMIAIEDYSSNLNLSQQLHLNIALIDKPNAPNAHPCR